MALTTVEGRSTLNPNAPLFIPAAYQVEDFSPEWWQLVTTSTWYRNYWLSQHQDGGDYFDNPENDIDELFADLLPEAFDLDTNEELNTMEAEFEEFIQSSLNEAHKQTGPEK